MKVFAETERLILREILDSDLEGMFALDSNPIVHEYLGKKPIKTKEESVRMITIIRNQYRDNGIGRWAAIEKHTGDFIGWSGLKFYTDMSFNNHINFYDIGYRLLPKYWGKGYATESIKAALNYAFKEMNLKTVYGITEKGNQASHNVLLKLGLTYLEDFFYEKETMPLRWYKIENK